MATFYPTIEEIEAGCLTEPVTQGELSFLHILEKLDDSYEVFFQAHINLYHPDIVILRKGGGIFIVEVKDWHLSSYKYSEQVDNKNNFGMMSVCREGKEYLVKTPFEQAESYKNELYDVLSPALHVGKAIDKRIYGLSTAAVYFASENEASVQSFFGEEHFTRGKNRELMFDKWYVTWGRDSTRINKKIETKLRPDYKSLFSDEMYNQVKSLYAPSVEIAEQQSIPTLRGSQKQYAESRPGSRQKIKGVAGSGKTLVLAHRAVSCFKRCRKSVLILTFNITLTHYIKDMVARLRRNERLPKDAFHYHNIHAFVRAMIDKHGIPYDKSDDLPDSYADEILEEQIKALTTYKNEINFRKYCAILVDEVQDFKYEWLSFLQELFLLPYGEFIVFGDEKQNIYSRSLEERLPRTPIKGRWAEFKIDYRTTMEIGELAFAFQKEFFINKYEISHAEYAQQTDMYSLMKPRQAILYCDISDTSSEADSICEKVRKFRTNNKNIAWNDICILAETHELCRKISNVFYVKDRIKSVTVSESQEEYCQLQVKLDKSSLRKELKVIRRIKKKAFWMNPGVMKICTIHSFKGWEISNVFLVIESEDAYPDVDRPTDELIYTAMTRAKNSLIVINHGNRRYRDFFETYIPCSHTHAGASKLEIIADPKT